VLRAGEHDTEADQRRLVRQLAIVATVVAALCLFGVVVFHVVMTQNQFRLDALRSDASESQAEYDRLRLQVSQLESPDRVVSDAQTRLGMITPPKVTYLTPSVDEPGPGWAAVKPLLAER
jgi:cell division protein FtsL